MAKNPFDIQNQQAVTQYGSPYGGEPQTSAAPPLPESGHAVFPEHLKKLKPKYKPVPKRRRTPHYGTTMFEYLHAYENQQKAPKEPVAQGVNATDIVSPNPDAAKTALSILGSYSGKNPLGLNLSLDVARNLWFGKDKASALSPTDEAEFRNLMESGDTNFDKKLVRQFVNNDGSTTYELLNPDKSIMSRFTLGELDGKKMFVQGGYSDYANEVRRIMAQSKQQQAQSGAFDKMRKKLIGGL